MCGIVGYIGHREAYPIIIKGLQRLEYRGYDSAGVMVYNEDGMLVCKTKGKVADLATKCENDLNLAGTLGMGHTRWATHGVPNDVNSHPHVSNSGNLSIIHNGIIENYEPLKIELIKRGYKFVSDTDTEVLINLIEISCSSAVPGFCILYSYLGIHTQYPVIFPFSSLVTAFAHFCCE